MQILAEPRRLLRQVDKAVLYHCRLRMLAVFPKGRFDDRVDATAQFLDWCKLAARVDGIYAYSRVLHEEGRRREGAAPV